MAHNIEYGTYPESIDKKAVQAEWDNYVRHECWQEGSSGLVSPIRWIDFTCGSRKEAEEYIERHDKGWYDQLAVKFMDYSCCQPSSREKQLKEREQVLYNRYMDKRGFHLNEVKSEFRSCPNCKSKLAVKFLIQNGCPVCGTDLRSETAIKAQETARLALKKAQEDLEKEQAKPRKGGQTLWLVKVEYHT